MNDEYMSEARQYCDNHDLLVRFEHGGKKIYSKDVVAAYVAGREKGDAELSELKEVLQNLFKQLNGQG